MSEIRLTDPQYELVTAQEAFPCFCAGLGAGKTHAGIARAIAKKFQNPRQNVAYYLPTYDLVRTFAFSRFAESLEALDIRYRLNKVDALIDFGAYGNIIFRTMDTPERIIGYEVADSVVDELDTMPMEKATTAWNKIVARNRQRKDDGTINTAAVVTTPEGFSFIHKRWIERKEPGYRIIRATTYSNAKNLPAGYIDNLKATYPSNLIAAYLMGEFVSMAGETVYPDFKRELNASWQTIEANEPLHVGMDFNVGHMAAVVFVLRNGMPHAVKEYTKVFDTPEMCALLKKRHPGHQIIVYPDASGGSRKTNEASKTDLSILKDSGFRVFVNPANPAVKDRVLSLSSLIMKRDLRINLDTCPELVEALEKQCYNKNGEPDKKQGHDHIIDAAGYFIAYRYPLTRGYTLANVA